MNFYDGYGRVHHKPVTEEKPFPSNNGFCYAGYDHVVGNEVDIDAVDYCWNHCQTKYGFNRHPDGDDAPASSHDEPTGMFMMWDEQTANWWYRKYKDQKFQICNLDFEPRSLWTLNPFKVIRDLWRLSKEDEPRKHTYKYPYIFPITFRHLPQHTYFYARCAGEKVGFFHTLWFLIASLATIDSDNTSSKLMLGMKLVKLNTLGLNWAEYVVAQMYDDAIDILMEAEEYFEPYNEQHPTVIALRRMTPKQRRASK